MTPHYLYRFMLYSVLVLYHIILCDHFFSIINLVFIATVFFLTLNVTSHFASFLYHAVLCQKLHEQINRLGNRQSQQGVQLSVVTLSTQSQDELLESI